MHRLSPAVVRTICLHCVHLVDVYVTDLMVVLSSMMSVFCASLSGRPWLCMLVVHKRHACELGTGVPEVVC